MKTKSICVGILYIMFFKTFFLEHRKLQTRKDKFHDNKIFFQNMQIPVVG